jgi:protein-tyrosine phosphatase
MQTPIRWIEGLNKGRLAVAPKPLGGDYLPDEVLRWKLFGVNVVASMLPAEESARNGLEKEAELCQAQGISFLSFPILDHGVPQSRREVAAFAHELNMLLVQDKTVLIHCFAGIGRSGLMAACVLTMRGMPPVEAFDRIAAARGCQVPDTMEQLNWVVKFAERMKEFKRREA